MAPIPVTYHDHPPTPTTRQILLPVSVKAWPESQPANSFYITYSRKDIPAHGTPKPSPLIVPVVPTEQEDSKKPGSVHESSASSQSGSSSTPTTISLRSSKRRKALYKPFNNSTPHITLRPMLEPILLRCLPSYTSNGINSNTHTRQPTSTSQPNTATSSAESSKPPSTRFPNLLNTRVLHPYSRLTDGANTRSSNPSPKEIKRREKMEEEKFRLKKESAALARNVKKKGKKGGRGGSRAVEPVNGSVVTNAGVVTKEANGNGTTKKRSRSTSPVKPTAKSINPDTITTSADPSTESSQSNTHHLPLPLRGGMKRTRSGGLSIATNLGIAHSASALGSPLRAVTGPESDDSTSLTRAAGGEEPEELEEGDNEREKKRSKLSTSSAKSGHRKAVSHSPSTIPQPLTSPLLPQQSTTIVGEGSGEKKRRGSHNLSAGAGATDMRRVVSVGGEAVGGRLKRNLILPGRLRDYDVRPGGALV